MARPITVCGFCDQPAVWRWTPENPPPPAYHSLLCDDHAASRDLDDLHELTEFPTRWDES